MRSVAVATSLLLVVGCATELPSGNIFIVRGVVAGTVTAAGAPVTVVTVIATAQYPSSGPPLVITDSTRPDNAGHYLVSLAVQNVPDARAPLDVRFRPDAGSGLPTRDTTGLQVLLTIVKPPPESTYVDMSLSP